MFRTALLIVLAGTFTASAQFAEYQLKAVYLERIARFLRWPGAEAPDDAQFVVGVIGTNPFGPALAELYATRKIKNKPILVRHLSEATAVDGCHMLFIPGTERDRLDAILVATRGKPIVTVGDTAGFAQKGVMVNFYIEREKLRFEINEKQLHQAGIEVDSLILKVARVVKSAEK